MSQREMFYGSCHHCGYYCSPQDVYEATGEFANRTVDEGLRAGFTVTCMSCMRTTSPDEVFAATKRDRKLAGLRKQFRGV